MPEQTKLKPCHCGQQDYCIGQAALLPGITCKIAAWDTGPKSELERLAREVDECYRLMGKIPADQPNLNQVSV